MFGRTVRIVASAVAAALVLAGCGGGPLKMGSAAIVGDDRITVATLQDAVQDWAREFRADRLANDLRSRQPGRDQPATVRALDLLVAFHLADELARREGITVTPAQVDRTISSLEGNRRNGVRSLVLSLGLPARYARDFARLRTILNEVRVRTRLSGRQPEQELVRTAKDMDIKVNPRYGTFDIDRLAIGPVTYELSAPESGVR